MGNGKNSKSLANGGGRTSTEIIDNLGLRKQYPRVVEMLFDDNVTDANLKAIYFAAKDNIKTLKENTGGPYTKAEVNLMLARWEDTLEVSKQIARAKNIKLNNRDDVNRGYDEDIWLF